MKIAMLLIRYIWRKTGWKEICCSGAYDYTSYYYRCNANTENSTKTLAWIQI